MRRDYISPEFEYVNVPGTLNTVEITSYFGSKMLEIEDKIFIGSDSIVYYQKSNNEQVDLDIESKLNPYILDVKNLKLKSHKLELDKSQTESQKNDKTKWILTISIQEILVEYLFATLKKYRTFEGVSNTMTLYNDVNVAIKNYILNNIIGRYKLKVPEIYLEYVDLHGQNILKFNNNFNENAQVNGNKLNRFEVSTDYNNTILEIKFTQEKPSSQFNFSYYFNINFDKI